MSFKTFRKTRQAYHTSGARVNGSWVDGPRTPFEILCSVQPVSGQELENTPELRRRSGGKFKIYTDDDELNTVSGSQNPDIIEFDGKEFDVFQRANWTNDVITHNKYYISERVNR
jgi:hypothetical protein